MSDIYGLVPFLALFPVQAMDETRTVTTRGHPRLPDDTYAFIELYCFDPQCDCRRVMINVLPEGKPAGGFLASISFGFDRDAEMAGPFLDPLNPQSRYAEALLGMFEQLISDPSYVARLQSHYRQVKDAAGSGRLPLATIRHASRPAPRGRQRKPVTANDDQVYQLKVTLKGTRPPIWRRVQVVGGTTLRTLHEILQTVMEWEGYHLYEFTVGGMRFGEPDEEWGEDVNDDRKATLASIAPVARSKFRYQYDFGDDWQHEILVEKILPPDPQVKYPICLTGKRSAPPEDCGGIWGYAELLEALADPDNPEHGQWLEWVGPGFDSETFDIESINLDLKRFAKRKR